MLYNAQVLETARNGLKGRAPRPARIVVLGAGVSGLVTARELLRAGHDVVVLEARGRAGGRIRTERGPWAGEMKAELGAMRIPLSHKLTIDYIEKLGLRTRPFPLDDPNAYHLTAGRLRRMRELAPAELPRLRDVLEPVMEQARRGGAAWERLAARYEGLSMREFLSELGMSCDHLDALSLMAGTDSLLCASALELVRDALGGFFETQALTIEGGMESFPATLARGLDGRIRYRTRVVALDQQEDGVTVHCDNGRIEGDYAVVTIPFSVLRYIDVGKSFSAAKQRAIRGLHYEPAAKLYFAFRRRFWEDEGITAGVTYTDLPIRKLYYLEEGREAGQGLLLSYCTGRDAQRWTALGERAALEEGLRCITRLHPSAIDAYEDGVAKLWQKDPYAGGAFAFCQPHEEGQFAEPARMPEGRFYFAGEHTSCYRRWIQGALESGLRAAQEVHRRAADQEPALWAA